MAVSRMKAATIFRGAPIVFGFAAIASPAFCGNAPPPARASRALGDHPNQPAAAPRDVSSINAIVTAFAESISAPAGGMIDRKRLDSLFVPGGRIAIGVDPKPGRAPDVAFVSPDFYADLAGRGLKTTGFFDRVIANHVERFGIMAHVYSSYGSRERPDDPEPFRRGVKSLELLQSGGRWYIVEVFYDFERPGTPIPPEYLVPSP
ncbi:hypothetical protein [Lichenicoccus sp.]|uniref:hypothetical protein n=1 Tax=Lichenicoccus sp. TaxID=2781899 RepID=UPI003D0D8BA5